MGKVTRGVFLGLAIGALVVAAGAQSAHAKKAPRHYAKAGYDAATCHGNGRAWCRRPRPAAVREAEAEALLQCLLDQPFATCD